jgi:hypothetical protein
MMSQMEFSDAGPLKRDVAVAIDRGVDEPILTGELGMGGDNHFAEVIFKSMIDRQPRHAHVEAGLRWIAAGSQALTRLLDRAGSRKRSDGSSQHPARAHDDQLSCRCERHCPPPVSGTEGSHWHTS